jgi:CRISPR-associated protein Csh1
MFEECLDVFTEMLKNEDNLNLKGYIPADGSYIIVKQDGTVKNADINFDKKTKETRSLICTDDTLLSDICFYDYHSKLISMNKPIDSKKVIHSNNYLAFAVKKESIVTGKLTEVIIDNYYDTLKNPLEKKYKKSKSKEASKIYKNFEEEYSAVDGELLEKCRSWIKQHIFSIDKLINVDLEKKEYLKIFFEVFEVNEDEKDIKNENRELFIQEDNRYIYPNIYNKSEYIINIQKGLDKDRYGLPYYGINMNDKKPFLKIKTRKVFIPYLLDMKEALLQKQFFEYLMNLASDGKNNVYVDIVNNKIEAYGDKEEREKFAGIEAGYYLRIQKGKELEIQVQDNLVNYQDKLLLNFNYQDFFKMNIEKYPEYMKDIGIYTKRTDVGKLINNIFFSKYLLTNYFTEANDISVKDSVLKRVIIIYRNVIFDWVYKGIDNDFNKVVNKFSLDLIINSVVQGDLLNAIKQLNLRWSFKDYYREEGEKTMKELVSDIVKNINEKMIDTTANSEIKTDDEYYYAIGLFTAYLISLSKTSKKTHALANPILDSRSNRMIINKLETMYKKYNYIIEINKLEINNLYAMILAYTISHEDIVINEDMIQYGFLRGNILYNNALQ